MHHHLLTLSCSTSLVLRPVTGCVNSVGGVPRFDKDVTAACCLNVLTRHQDQINDSVRCAWYKEPLNCVMYIRAEIYLLTLRCLWYKTIDCCQLTRI
ncbi:hypothetical protein BRADI_4g08405v3 [Brachypodium distachyon]|uniref:Prolamin-like domain-containing protein n=1 Tax=Brachypodium distachyon TaxID=15368 RepID=A0A2K2CL89_BRADI|nr:hypothetical protein BRADI_4g08405v3 [Brachypodium distachyon]